MAVELPPSRPIKQRSGWQVMLASIHALLMRELQTRFGGYRLGYLWAPIEAGMQMVIFLVIFGVLMTRVMPGIDYAIFLVSGMAPWFMFTNIASRSLGAVQANQGLLMYRSVAPIDAILSRGVLELTIYFFTFVLFMGILLWLGYEVDFGALHVVLLCWLSLFIFAIGFALIMMVIGHYAEEVGKVISILFTVMYFASGILYSVHIVPEPYLSYLMYNPIIHNIELMRHSLAPTYPNYHVSFLYFLEWTLVVLFVGLLLYKFAEKDMTRTK